MAPPEVEPPVARRVPTRITQRQPTSAPPEEPRSRTWQLTKQQKIMIAAIAGALVIGVLAIWMFSGSKTEKKAQVPHSVPSTVSNPVEPQPATPPPIALGALSVRTNVEGADVFVGKDLKGSTNSSKKLDINLPVGSYAVHVEKPGYEPSNPQSVEIASNENAFVKFTLNPSGNTPNNPPPKESYLIITGNSGAEVLVDGSVWGKLPPGAAAYVKVTPGSEHRIELSLKGYEPWSDRKTVKAGERLAVSANLKPLPSPPPSVTFSASALKIQKGESVTLRWQTTNATEVSIEPSIGDVKETSGQRQISPSDTTTYILTAKGAGQPVRSSPVVVTVIPAPLPLPTASLTATSPVQQGQSATLSWTAQNAKSVSIDNGIGSVDPKGQRQVTPGSTTTYTLTAKGADETTVTTTARVEVRSAPPPPQPPQPRAETTGSDSTAIKDALRRLSEAYGTESVDEMQKVWPRMNKAQKSKLNGLFNSVRALRTEFDSCSSPSVSGDVATLTCTQTISFTTGGKFQPGKPIPVSISLKKAGSGWQIESVEGK